jgi:hypothetical protein
VTPSRALDDTRRALTRRVLTGALLAASLACGGLIPPSDPVGDAVVDAVPTTEPAVADPVLPTAEVPELGADPYAQFAPLDASEAPPEAKDPACPAGASVIRYPRPPAMEVYCATTAGMKQGPWQRVQGRQLTELRTYDQGQQVGRAVRWANAIKIAEENYVAGKQEGDVAEWNDAGILMLRGTMVGGQRHGKFLLRSAANLEAFDGRCYQAGAETWGTADPADFVARTCP